MKIELINSIFGIGASLISVYSVIKSKKSEKNVQDLIILLHENGIDTNKVIGKKNKVITAKDNSAGIIGNGNSVELGRGGKQSDE